MVSITGFCETTIFYRLFQHKIFHLYLLDVGFLRNSMEFLALKKFTVISKKAVGYNPTEVDETRCWVSGGRDLGLQCAGDGI